MPPTSSILRPCWFEMAPRNRPPAHAAAAWPSRASPNTSASETTTRANAVSIASTIQGATCSPTKAPPKNPQNDSPPTRKPWR